LLVQSNWQIHLSDIATHDNNIAKAGDDVLELFFLRLDLFPVPKANKKAVDISALAALCLTLNSFCSVNVLGLFQKGSLKQSYWQLSCLNLDRKMEFFKGSCVLLPKDGISFGLRH